MVGPVYHISCDDCYATFVGETEQSLKARFLEHQRKSSVGNEMPQHVHMDRPGHRVSLDKVMILTVENRKFKRRVKEMIYIWVVKLSLNKDGGCYLPPGVLTNLLRARIWALSWSQNCH